MSKNDDINDKKEEYRKKIEDLTGNLDDDYLLGYSEAILNILDIFTNGKCEDCPFSFESEYHCSDFIYPEYDLKCKLDECWTDTVKKLLKG